MRKFQISSRHDGSQYGIWFAESEVAALRLIVCHELGYRDIAHIAAVLGETEAEFIAGFEIVEVGQ